MLQYRVCLAVKDAIHVFCMYMYIVHVHVYDNLYIPSSSFIVTICVSEGLNVTASLGVALSIDTEKSWSPSRILSSVVGMLTQPLRGNAVPAVNDTVYVPSVKSAGPEKNQCTRSEETRTLCICTQVSSMHVQGLRSRVSVLMWDFMLSSKFCRGETFKNIEFKCFTQAQN